MRADAAKPDTSRLIADVEKVALKLKKEYHDFTHHNKKNPLDELFFILCSIKRSEKVYVKAFKSLKRNFPRYDLLAATSTKKLSRTISWGGLQNQKAAVAKEIIKRLIESFGKPTLAPLEKMSDEGCESYLTSLPGIGKKVARCVMLYSLNMKVFPVDSHCWRISKRLGWIKSTSKHQFCSSRNMDLLQEMIPSKLRLSLHVNMVSLGRDKCSARLPKCGTCPIARYCQKIDVYGNK